MDYLAPAALLWVVVFILLGIVRGFWKALAAVVSLVGAYCISAYFAPALSEFFLRVFETANLGETVTWAASATLLFVLAGLIIRLLIVLLGRSIPITNRALDAAGGALLSGAYGAVTAMVLVWGAALLIDTYRAQQARANPGLVGAEHPAPGVVVLSRRLVADVVGWNARKSGVNDDTAKLVAAYARQPQELLSAVQNSVRSDEFKQVVASESLQRLMREQDVEAVQKSPEFSRLMNLPSVQQLRTMVAANEPELSEQAMAKHMVTLWNGFDELKNNPQITVIIDDPEVQSFLQEDGAITPSLLAKGQKLLRVLASDNDKVVAINDLPDLYQWHDEEGQLQVTEYHEIPLSKQNQAVKLVIEGNE